MRPSPRSASRCRLLAATATALLLLPGAAATPEATPEARPEAAPGAAAPAPSARTLLREGDEAAKVRAAMALGASGDAAAAAPLVDALSDAGAAVREAAAKALARLGTVEAIPFVARLLADEAASCRETARAVLEDLARRPDAATPLLLALNQPPAVREGLMQALAASDDDRALAGLGAAIADEDAKVSAAAERIVRMSPRDRAGRAVAGCLDSASDAARLACAQLAGEMKLAAALPRLAGMAAARIDEKPVLAAVRQAIAQMKDDLDFAALLETARSGRTAAERVSALAVLAAQRDERGYQALVRALGDAEEVVRASAADALGDFGNARAVGPLSRELDDPRNARIRRSIKNALDRLTGARN